MRRCDVSVLGAIRDWLGDFLASMSSLLKCRRALVAENLFLRKQLAFYREHQVRPRPLTDSARFSLALLSRWFEWKDALAIVKPDTLIRWHRQGFRLVSLEEHCCRPPDSRERWSTLFRGIRHKPAGAAEPGTVTEGTLPVSNLHSKPP